MNLLEPYLNRDAATKAVPVPLRFTNGADRDVSVHTFRDAELYRALRQQPENIGIRNIIDDSLITHVPEWTHGQEDDSAGSRGYHFRRLVESLTLH